MVKQSPEEFEKKNRGKALAELCVGGFDVLSLRGKHYASCFRDKVSRPAKASDSSRIQEAWTSPTRPRRYPVGITRHAHTYTHMRIHTDTRYA